MRQIRHNKSAVRHFDLLSLHFSFLLSLIASRIKEVRIASKKNRNSVFKMKNNLDKSNGTQNICQEYKKSGIIKMIYQAVL